MMDWIYTAISWILLRWHQLWDAILPGSGTVLGTTWPWILSIIFLVITVRIILFPIFVKQIRSQRAMQALQPKMKELQTKYKGDQQTLREEMMKLYQSEKVNPLMGCLPMFLQIPVFLGLFHVLQRLDPVQYLNTTLYGWSQAEWDSAARAKLFNVSIAARFADSGSWLDTLQSNGVAVKILAGVLVLIMMGTTFLTSRQMILKTGWNADPQQRMIQKLMLYGIPFSLLLSGWYFPIGVIIYWVTQNLFSLGQQYWVLHKYPPPVTAGNIPLGRGAAKSTPAVKGATATKPAPGAKPPAKKTVTAQTGDAKAGAAKAAGTAKAGAAKAGSDKSSGAKAGAAASNGGGFVNPVEPEDTRSGLFRRKVETPPPAPEPAEVRSTAPKPGAKPVNPKSGVKRTTPTRKSPANRKGGPRR